MKRLPNIRKCNTFEHAIWNISGKNVSFVILAVYHPPYTKSNGASNNVFLDEFLDFMADFVPIAKNIIITEDFNMHVDDCENQDGSCLNDNIKAMGYDQHVQFPTHRSCHTLDLVITEHHNNMKVIACDAGSFISDHCSVEFILRLEKENILSETKLVEIRRM